MTIDLQAERARLFALAYRMLGSAADAEDVVQEALTRLQEERAPPAAPGAWLTTVATRLCLDRARSAAAQRIRYVGPWLPEPVATPEMEAAPDPGERLSAAESVSIAFLLVLERLSPLERAVFLLREIFDLDFPAIAASIGRSEAACRQLLRRAREHVAAARPRFTPAREAHRNLVIAFLQACRAGDVEELQRLLAEEVQLVADGGGKASAALNVITGADRVTRFVVGVARKLEEMPLGLGWVNGELAFILWNGDGTADSVTVLSLAPDGERIARIQTIRNPDKLRGFHRAAARARA